MAAISIVVPVYKVEDYLDRCISSILNQSYSDFELLLVDDGSPDQCGAMCEAYAEQDNRIRVFHKENGGQGSARNLALDWIVDNSDSLWITFADSDDWLHKDYLKILLETAHKWNAKISMCEYHITGKMMPDAAVSSSGAQKIEAEDAIVQYYRLCTAPWGKLYAKELFATLRFEEARAFEDAFITHIPVFEAGFAAYTEEKLYYYYENIDSTTRKKWTPRNLVQIKAHETRVRYCLEHGYKRAYAEEMEQYVIACYAQATALHYAIKENSSYRKYWKEIRPVLLPVLREARKCGRIPFNKKYLWIYEIAYPIKPVWVLRNYLEKYCGLNFPN